MTASVNTNDRARDRWLPLVTIGALLAAGLYIGAYIFTCTKVEDWSDSEVVLYDASGRPWGRGISHDGPVEFTARYALPSVLDTTAMQHLCQRLFSPLYTVDRYIRPQFWAWPEFDLKRQIRALEEYRKRTRGATAIVDE
ncbi:MAG TPA: hypothetical protein VHB77_19165 [Planctomycetaceae bacterium]|nr:hypothetical protein [Planctomycetaceae bacterium]